jgi:hypothetical protein
MDLFSTAPESWHDFRIEKIVVEYDDILVNLSNENQLMIKCSEYIHFSSFAHWDENILKSISIDEKTELIQVLLKTIHSKYGDNYFGGGTKSLSDKYYCIKFEFLDGNLFEVVCKNHIIFHIKIASLYDYADIDSFTCAQ